MMLMSAGIKMSHLSIYEKLGVNDSSTTGMSLTLVCIYADMSLYRFDLTS